MNEIEIFLEKEHGEKTIALESEGTLILPKLEDLEVTPTKEQQVFNHKNSDGYDNVKVNPIPEEYIIPEGMLPITENTTYDVRRYARVSASVHPAPNLQDKSITITENGTQNITADSGYDGLGNVEVTTEISGGGSATPVLQNKNITISKGGQQTITFDEGFDGLQSINLVVNIAPAKLFESFFGNNGHAAAMQSGVVPCAITFGFNETTKTSKLSNSVITKIVTSFARVGTITIGKVDLREYKTGVMTILEGKKYSVSSDKNEIEIDNMVLGEHETLIIGDATDSSAFYYWTNIGSSLSLDGKLITSSAFKDGSSISIGTNCEIYGYKNY